MMKEKLIDPQISQVQEWLTQPKVSMNHVDNDAISIYLDQGLIKH